MQGSDRVIMGKVAVLLILCLKMSCAQQLQGRWELLLENAGVSSMHAALLHTDKVIMFDRTDRGPSTIARTDPPCNNISLPPPWDSDCWAHSVEYDIATNKVRPLHVVTDTWCSSGAFATNGTLVQTGGFGKGINVTRYFTPCKDAACDWDESPEQLSADRWYASNQILPDGRVIVLGGLNSFSYEFVPKTTPGEGVFYLNFLWQIITQGEGNNLYPFLHLSSDGNLFVFANSDSILLDWKTNKVVRNFPAMPGGGARNYPSSGSSVMLPLESANNFQKVEILICGGAPVGAYSAAEGNKTYRQALNNCGRIEITSENPQWQMEDMPGPRVMNDMLILPTGEILLINGARNGSAGWQDARVAELSPWLYRPREATGARFTVLAPSTIPRVYHSTANVLPDGRVLVAGSNPNEYYNFSSSLPFPTELRVEAYVPYYLDSQSASTMPNIAYINPWASIEYGSNFTVNFSVSELSSDVRFHAYAPPFATHSVSMSQRMLSLAAATSIANGGNSSYSVTLTAPPSAVAAPSGYYLLTVVNGGVPSQARWIRFVL